MALDHDRTREAWAWCRVAFFVKWFSSETKIYKYIWLSLCIIPTHWKLNPLKCYITLPFYYALCLCFIIHKIQRCGALRISLLNENGTPLSVWRCLTMKVSKLAACHWVRFIAFLSRSKGNRLCFVYTNNP